MKNWKLILLAYLLVPIVVLFYSASGVNADSGFDVGYDGGGSSSSDSGGSWGGSSSGSRRHVDYPLWYICLIGGVCGSVIVCAFIATKHDSSKYKKEKNEYKIVNENDARKIIPDFNSKYFIDSRYADFVVIQKAWMNFDYDVLRNKLTDELYNQYIFQLDIMKIKRTQNIMRNFKLIDGHVIEITKNKNKIIAKIELMVSFIDYIEYEGEAIRGSNKNAVNVRYIMTFIRSDGSEIDKCPRCGAKIKNTSSQTCKYCRTTITRIGSDWVLAKKENKKQW